jgi:hypothetical protein
VAKAFQDGRTGRRVVACIGMGALALSGCHRTARPQAGVRPGVAPASVQTRIPAPRFPVLVPGREPIPAGWLFVPSLRAPAASGDVIEGVSFRPEMTLGASECRWRCVLVVSIADRALWLVDGSDTLFRASAAVASGARLVHEGRAWTFRTPPGERRVLRKVIDPVWTPPDWHYAEAARDHQLKLTALPTSGALLSRGRRLEIRGGVVGIVAPGQPFRALPVEEHIVFDGRLFIPPIGTRNRRLKGDLGRHALDLGDGYMIHGTLLQASIGRAATHGCIRLRDRDIAWLFENVPVGTRVLIR